MVSIKASHTIFPSESTPKDRLWLSESDQTVPRTLIPTIYIYKPNPNQGSIDILGDSLAKILVYYYPLAGRLIRTEDGRRLELDCNTMGVKLLEAESSKTLAEYGDFAPNETIKELIPMVDYSEVPIEGIPLLMVQLTRFRDGDGIAVGTAMSHVLADGVAAIRFINSWAKLARGEALDRDEKEPFLDRTVLKLQPRSAPRFHHAEFKPLPLVLGSSNTTTERKEETSVALLKLTSEQVQNLKKKANTDQPPRNEGSRTRPYSRCEAISAHIWRSACKAREGHTHQPTVVRVIADIRNRTNPPLPSNFFGNARVPTVTPTCHSGGIIEKPLSYGAQKIREAIEVLSDEYVRSQLDYLASLEDYDRVRNFHGNPNVNIVSWMSMSVYEVDFGWGKPVYVGPGSLSTDGQAYIIPRGDGDGSVVLAIRLQIAHLQLFHRFFYEDIYGQGL